ncbi:MAG TPA: hypothetical protein VMV46_17620 [Thermoanaerobaculia bacterium]|nr:hypothetical protein [Thermoanaerobaculia bacterium]
MSLNVPEDRYREIEALITSADSPVGIDAKKTHVLILHQLLELERRLIALEERVGRGGGGG